MLVELHASLGVFHPVVRYVVSWLIHLDGRSVFQAYRIIELHQGKLFVSKCFILLVIRCLHSVLLIKLVSRADKMILLAIARLYPNGIRGSTYLLVSVIVASVRINENLFLFNILVPMDRWIVCPVRRNIRAGCCICFLEGTYSS